jgi:hypothetical protein
MLSTQGSVIGMVIPPYRTRSPALLHPSNNNGEDEAERLMPSARNTAYASLSGITDASECSVVTRRK